MPLNLGSTIHYKVSKAINTQSQTAASNMRQSMTFFRAQT